MSWVKQNATPNLNEAKAETRVALPSLMTWGTHPMLTFLEGGRSIKNIVRYEKMRVLP